MKEGPDIAAIAALIGDPARANILTALMSGKALTATELAAEAGVTAQTASSHLGKLQDGGLITLTRQGRHRYFTLANADVAALLETLMGLAAGHGQLRTRTGPKDAAMREARVCYNHLAGRRGVQMFRWMRAHGLFDVTADGIDLSAEGRRFATEFGIDLSTLAASRAPMCKECLDWSAREAHLASKLGRAMLGRMEETGWVKRDTNSRVVRFTPLGTQAFDQQFGQTARHL